MTTSPEKIVDGLLGFSLSTLKMPNQENRKSYEIGFAAGYLTAKSRYETIGEGEA